MLNKYIFTTPLILFSSITCANECQDYVNFAKTLSKNHDALIKAEQKKYKELENLYNQRFDQACKDRSVQQVDKSCEIHEKRWQRKIENLILDRNKQYLIIDKIEGDYRGCLHNLVEINMTLNDYSREFKNLQKIDVSKDKTITELEAKFVKFSENKRIEKNGVMSLLRELESQRDKCQKVRRDIDENNRILVIQKQDLENRLETQARTMATENKILDENNRILSSENKILKSKLVDLNNSFNKTSEKLIKRSKQIENLDVELETANTSIKIYNNQLNHTKLQLEGCNLTNLEVKKIIQKLEEDNKKLKIEKQAIQM